MIPLVLIVGAGRLELPPLAGYGSEPYAYTKFRHAPNSRIVNLFDEESKPDIVKMVWSHR